jgi:hypothetical protein
LRLESGKTLRPVFTKIVIVGVIAVTLLAWALRGRDNSVPLKASIQPSGFQINLANREELDLSDCVFEVNESHRSPPFALKAGQSMQLSLSDLKMPDGLRFNPISQRIVKAALTCRMPDGAHRSAVYSVR